MENAGSLLKYVTGPWPLIGFTMLVLASIMKSIPRVDPKARRYYALALLGLGGLVIVGSLMFQLGQSADVTGNVIVGHGNTVGSHNGSVARTSAAPESQPVHRNVEGNTVVGDQNVLGNDNVPNTR